MHRRGNDRGRFGTLSGMDIHLCGTVFVKNKLKNAGDLSDVANAE